jgi:glycosyltransferase involved in cell wall biosynthesis
MISVIIPIFNESGNIGELCSRLRSSLDALERRYEVIFVDDGSTDGSEARLTEIAQQDKRFKVVVLARNFGQTAAMMAGIDLASGDILLPMDGDLQNDPSDIKHLIAKLEEGYDVVSGWRKNRKDSELTRNIPSRMANRLISLISGVQLHDYGCSLKAYRACVIKGVKLYGEMHRFIPIYASWNGARVTEIPVSHHPRVHGESKYGFERVLKVVLDLIVVKFLARYATKPIYIFGGFGLLSIFVSVLAGIYSVYLKLFAGTSFILTPLPLLVVMAFITGVMSILMGLIAELVMRTWHESQGKTAYQVRVTLNLGSNP